MECVMEWNVLFFWVECIRNQSFLSGEMRDCSHPIWWSGCGSCRCNKHEGHNKKRVREIKRRPLHPLLKQGWTFCKVAFHVLRHFYIPLQANHEIHICCWYIVPFEPLIPYRRKRKHSTNQLCISHFHDHKKRKEVSLGIHFFPFPKE